MKRSVTKENKQTKQVDNIYNHKRKKTLYNSKWLESLLFFQRFFFNFFTLIVLL